MRYPKAGHSDSLTNDLSGGGGGGLGVAVGFGGVFALTADLGVGLAGDDSLACVDGLGLVAGLAVALAGEVFGFCAGAGLGAVLAGVLTTALGLAFGAGEARAFGLTTALAEGVFGF